MSVSHLLVPHSRNRLCWDRSCLGELMRFGKWVFLSTLCTFLADQTDRLVVGKLTSLEILGVYQIAHQFCWMPVRMLYIMSAQVIFPLYSRYHHSPEGIGPAIRRIHPLIAGFSAVLATGLFAAGPTLIACLYGSRYQAAGWMVQLLAVAALFKMLEASGSAILLATGHSRAPAVSNGVKTLALVMLLPVGYYAGGLPGLIVTLAGTDLLRYAATAWGLRRRGLGVLRYDLALILLIAGISVAARAASQYPALATHRWLKLGTATCVGLSLWAVVILSLLTRQLRRSRSEGTA
jgi:O-antigen/teichoic acid export membrane protein